MKFTDEEKAVIDEFITKARKGSSENIYDRMIVRAGESKNQMIFDFRHGKGASYELLHKALLYIKENYDLTSNEFAYLKNKAKVRFKYDINSWEYSEERPNVKSEMIISEGEGYMIIEGGFRVDYGHDWYEHLREQFKKTGIYDPGLR